MISNTIKKKFHMKSKGNRLHMTQTEVICLHIFCCLHDSMENCKVKSPSQRG